MPKRADMAQRMATWPTYDNSIQGEDREHTTEALDNGNRSSQQRKCRIDRELALTFLTEDRLLRYSPSRGLATHGSAITVFKYGGVY